MTVARRGSYGPTRKLILLRTHSLLQVGDAERFPRALGLESLDLVFRISQQVPCFTAVDEDGCDKRLAEVELSCKADGVAPPDPV